MTDGPKSLLGDDFAEMYQTPADLANAGAWMDVDGKPGWRIKLRCVHSDYVRRRQFQRARKKGHAMKATPTFEKMNAESIDTLVTDLVVTWEGFNGLPYSEASARQVFETYDVFREACLSFALDRANYALADTEALAGN